MAEEDEKKSSDFVVIREPRKPDFHLGFHVYPQIQSWYLLTYNPNPDYTTFQRWKMYETEDFREEDPTAEDHAEVESPSFGQTSLMDMLEDSQFASVQETLIREAYRNPLADLLVVCDDLRTEVLRCILGDEPGRSKGQREWDYYKVWCFPFPPPPRFSARFSERNCLQCAPLYDAYWHCAISVTDKVSNSIVVRPFSVFHILPLLRGICCLDSV
jgi:hypothetical protein